MAISLEHDACLAPAEAARSHVTGRGIRAYLQYTMWLLFNLSALALIVASVVQTIGVLLYHFPITTHIEFIDRIIKQWPLLHDELTVYLVSGAIFLAAATVQARRGHVGIDFFAHILSEKVNQRRQLIVDVLVLAFCTLFAWKSGTLLHEAVAEGQTASTAWGPPLWIPYSVLTLGMTLLAIQVALQVGERSWIIVALVVAAMLGFLLWNSPPTGTITLGFPTWTGIDWSTTFQLPPPTWGRSSTTPFVTGVPQWAIGVMFCVITLIMMFSGMPIAFALGLVAAGFMIVFMTPPLLDTLTKGFTEELGNVIILAIPLFILKGAAIGRSDAGKDLYSALHAWLHKIPGGLGVANTVACGLFAAMAGSSPATCSAIGSAGIPEMRQRGYSPGFAAGIIAAGGTLGILLPPSVTMMLYAVAAEVSLGKLFLAGIGPGLLLIVLFAGYSVLRFRKEKRLAMEYAETTGVRSAILAEEHYTLGQKLRMIVWVAPFVSILAGVMVVLYAGWASPSATAGVGAVLAFLVIGIMYGIWRPSKLMPILTATLRESTMILMIVGTSLLFANVMSRLNISQATAAWIIGFGLSKWLLLAMILLFVMVLGFFLPPVSIILMTAPIILPPLKAAGFDLIWFGVVMTIVMEMGLIHPPVGLNIFVIKSIAPDIPLSDIIWGTLPFVMLMFVGVALICLLPDIAIWLPDTLIPNAAVPK